MPVSVAMVNPIPASGTTGAVIDARLIFLQTPSRRRSRIKMEPKSVETLRMCRRLTMP
jgi:hypothetical protein